MNNDNIDPQLQLPSNTTDNDNVSAATKSLGEISFVDWGQEHPKKKPRARLYHRKSRNGCTNCKSRKVKCNEESPTCGSCQRLELQCTYSTRSSPSIERILVSKGGEDGLANQGRSIFAAKGNACSSTASSSKEITSHKLPESGDRRNLELRLLHQYMGYTCNTLSIDIESQPKIEFYWKIGIPELAFEHEALLYSIFTIAALHLSWLEPNNKTMEDAYQRYLELTIKTHRDQFVNLQKSNADATCITSTFLRICAFAAMQLRDRDPYTPPVAWLSMTIASREVFVEAMKWISKDETSIAWQFWKATPQLLDWNAMFAHENRKDLDYLLARTPENEELELWDATIAGAYASTVSYIGGVKIAIEEGELESHVFRRVMTFAMYIQKKFLDLVTEQRPRALVILAHYFALLSRHKHLWLVGEVGKNEIMGIMTILPEEWKHLMAWPLEVLENPSLLRTRNPLEVAGR